MHQRGAFVVARFDNQGNAKAFMEETGNRTGSTLFLCLEKTHIGKLMGQSENSVASNKPMHTVLLI